MGLSGFRRAERELQEKAARSVAPTEQAIAKEPKRPYVRKPKPEADAPADKE